MIEYDITCTKGCLIYVSHICNRNDTMKTKSNSILDITEYSFFFDSALSKLFSLVERVSQFVNCFCNLGLKEDKPGGVSLFNVIREVEKQQINEISDYMNQINKESLEIRKIRNAITHHYHPLNAPLYRLRYENRDVHIEEALIPVKIISYKTAIESIQKTYINLISIINSIIRIAESSFKVDGKIIKEEGTAIDVQFTMNFEG